MGLAAIDVARLGLPWLLLTAVSVGLAGFVLGFAVSASREIAATFGLLLSMAVLFGAALLR